MNSTKVSFSSLKTFSFKLLNVNIYQNWEWLRLPCSHIGVMCYDIICCSKINVIDIVFSIIFSLVNFKYQS